MTFYTTNKNIMKFAGVVTALISIFALFFFIVVSGGDKFLMGAMSLLLASISIMCFHYKCEVIIDPENKNVTKTVFTRLWNKTESYPFSHFDKVEILSGGGGNPLFAEVIYFVHLDGVSKTCIPGAISQLDHAIEKGKQIAQTMNLPLENEPKIGFVMDLFERLT